jgi:hypothetical protein
VGEWVGERTGGVGASSERRFIGWISTRERSSTVTNNSGFEEEGGEKRRRRGEEKGESVENSDTPLPTKLREVPVGVTAERRGAMQWISGGPARPSTSWLVPGQRVITQTHET